MRPAARAAHERTAAFRAENKLRKLSSQRRSSSARTICSNKIFDTGSPEVGLCRICRRCWARTFAAENSTKAQAVKPAMRARDRNRSVWEIRFMQVFVKNRSRMEKRKQKRTL